MSKENETKKRFDIHAKIWYHNFNKYDLTETAPPVGALSKRATETKRGFKPRLPAAEGL